MQRVVTILGWLIAIACAIALATFFVALFVIASRSVPTNHEGDLGTWFGAVFAGLAFGGTIWLATTESRRRRRQESAHATLVFTVMKNLLRDARVHCKVVSDAMERLDPARPDAFPREYVEKGFAELQLWSLEDLIPLTFTHPNLARRLAELLGDINVIACRFDEPSFLYTCRDAEALAFLKSTCASTYVELNTLMLLCVPLGMGIEVQEEKH